MTQLCEIDVISHFLLWKEIPVRVIVKVVILFSLVNKTVKDL